MKNIVVITRHVGGTVHASFTVETRDNGSFEKARLGTLTFTDADDYGVFAEALYQGSMWQDDLVVSFASAD